eukprot:SAG11_NODE_1548_length_4703_cov_6.701564_4_plen_250_part_00
MQSAGEDEADFGETALSYDEGLERERWAQIMAGEESVRGFGNRTSLRWQLALVDDSNLQVVPGSHRRWRSADENAVLRHGAGEPLLPSGRQSPPPMPGGVPVVLRKGEAVIYSGLLLHHGCTTASAERLCLAGNWCVRVPDLMHDRARTCAFVACPAHPGRAVAQNFRNSVGGNDMPSLLDARLSHQMRPEVRAALPTRWMQRAWDRWMLTVVDDGVKDAALLNRAAAGGRKEGPEHGHEGQAGKTAKL